jgi:CheY-like chemotaxis protein/predicted transcriptional regulator
MRVRSGRTSAGVPVTEVMRADVVCVPADLPIAALAELMLARDLARAPVVDGGGRPIGMVALSDLARAGWDPERRGARCVADIMMPLAFTIAGSASLARAAALMAHEGIGRLIVCGPTGGVAGVVSSDDVMRWLARQEGYLWFDEREGQPVLVVDDDADIREQLAEILADEGYDVITAANGVEALERVNDGARPALILMDLFMPVMDGWALRAELEKDPRTARVPVVLLSGQIDARAEAERLHASACLVKPVPYPTLLGTVQKFVA